MIAILDSSAFATSVSAADITQNASPMVLLPSYMYRTAWHSAANSEVRGWPYEIRGLCPVSLLLAEVRQRATVSVLGAANTGTCV